MNRDTASITVTLDDLRILGAWAADCAHRVLPLFEAAAPDDPRPREAVDGQRVFAAGGTRTNELRSLFKAAYAAAREVGDPAAAAAARAAGLSASVAYTHAQVTADQTKHVLGPAAYAALARELSAGGDRSEADAEIAWAVVHASSQVRELIRRMPERDIGRGRLDELLFQLGAALRDAK